MSIFHRPGSPYSIYPSSSISGISVFKDDLIVVMHSFSSTVAELPCTDNAVGGSNSYSEAGSILQASGGIWSAAVGAYIFSATAKATETLTITCPTKTDPGISVHVYGGAVTSSPQDGAAVTFAETSQSTSHTSPNITTSVDETAIVAFLAQEDAASSASAWLNSFLERTDETGHVHHSADRCSIFSTGTYSTGFTSSATQAYLWLMVAFKAQPTLGMIGPFPTFRP